MTRPVVLLIVALVSVVAAPSAQSPARSDSPDPAFDSVALSWSETRGRGSARSEPANGSVAFTNITVREMIAEAYSITPNLARFTVLGGNDHLMSARLDLMATMPPNSSRDQQRLMLRTLLADRFNLQMHGETREIPVYALMVVPGGRLGPQLRASKYNCAAYTAAAGGAGRNPATDPARPRSSTGTPWCSTGLSLGPRAELVVRRAGQLRDLVEQVQGFLGRPLVDATGLSGNFEWVVRFTPGSDAAAAPDAAVQSAFELQLGLRLEPRTASTDVHVIDSVGYPSAF
jgi:uncharacterized protein (TIGR03435 family)